MSDADKIIEAAGRVVQRAFIECPRATHGHIWNAHGQCQWCHSTLERYEAAIVARDYSALARDANALEQVRDILCDENDNDFKGCYTVDDARQTLTLEIPLADARNVLRLLLDLPLEAIGGT